MSDLLMSLWQGVIFTYSKIENSGDRRQEPGVEFVLIMTFSF